METLKEVQLYYSKDGVIVRDSTPTDIAYLRNDLKKSDVDEIWASHHLKPYEALQEGMANSIECLTVLKDDRPVAMFGIVPVAEEGKAIIWMLSTPNLFRIALEFIRHTAGFVGFFFHKYPHFKVFFNFVDERNKLSIKWLEKTGALLGEPKPFGAEKMPFRYFEYRRPDHV